MLFNSLSFAIFFPIVFILYWFVTNKQLRFQNALLLISSYFFYSCWDYRFLFLLIFSTLLDFYSGLKIHSVNSQIQKKTWLWISIIINIGFLCIFKYYNFFISSVADFIKLFGYEINLWTLKIILPVGISFYTFHGLSYVIDIYYKRITPEKNLIDYSVFVSFFPLLVAGPIERATHLLPQIKQNRIFNYQKAIDGLRQILWGLFKKIVIADNCAEMANLIFNNSSNYTGSTLLLGALFFTFQIYGDFSGYSDIALGTARLLGIELLQNFSFPYFSRNIAEFWRRWHISLSSWFKDYLYIPLGGSKVSTIKKIRNVLIIFIVSGFWHGANWTFIVWGVLNAFFILPSVLLKTNRNNIAGIVAQGKYLPTIKEALSMITTFMLTVIAWIFFRAENLSHAISYFQNMFNANLFSIPNSSAFASSQHHIISITLLLIVFMFIEWIGRERRYALSHIGQKWPRWLRWGFYYSVLFLIIYFGGEEQEFIYFQF